MSQNKKQSPQADARPNAPCTAGRRIDRHMENADQSPLGTVYLWNSESASIEKQNVPLLRLSCPHHLSGRHVSVDNYSVVKEQIDETTEERYAIGNANPDGNGDFLFEPFAGGGRMDKPGVFAADKRQRYISASRFGEVNTYYHTDKVANYVDGLLFEIGVASIPQVIVRVNAHNAILKINCCCDGVLGKKSNRWMPLQGGHYRLPTHRRLTVAEHHPVAPNGEIHLGPGWKLTAHGALAKFVKCKYRCNASHNAGTIYHEYGHHLTRHTADFRANRLKAPHRQCNVKSDIDEAVCDYLAATMMDSPHIWALHHRHDDKKVHRRSLASKKTLNDFDHDRGADPHTNGTILAAALWDMRQSMIESALKRSHASSAFQNTDDIKRDAIRQADLLVINSLVLIGRIVNDPYRPGVKATRKLRSGFAVVLDAILNSDESLFNRRFRNLIEETFAKRKILIGQRANEVPVSQSVTTQRSTQSDGSKLIPAAAIEDSSHATLPIEKMEIDDETIKKMFAKDPNAIIPKSSELLSPEQLELNLTANRIPPYSLVAVGDVMIGSRARHRSHKFGPDYIFHAVAPLFRRSSIVVGNQEGPIARDAKKLPRNHSYKVDPKYTRVLRRAGFNAMSLANNHLLDCGRQGVTETLASLKKHYIRGIGAGENRHAAHEPAIMQAGELRVGLLGYYWNRRTAAKGDQPGSAMDKPERLASDIKRLRQCVDRVVVTVHWGVPYDQKPSQEDREKARLMIELGADVVIGHHPHIMQGVEFHHDRPIIYSVGNFAFGTGNTKAESLVVGVRFDRNETTIDFYPAYVKNRDPRVNYQPKIVTGDSAQQLLQRLAKLSGELSPTVQLEIENGIGRIQLPYQFREPIASETVSVI